MLVPEQVTVAVTNCVVSQYGINKVHLFYFIPLTQLFLSLSNGVVLGLTAAAGVFVFLQQHPLQAGPEQCRHANRLLSPGAVDNDGIQTTKAIALQQRHQSLEGRGQRMTQ